MARFLLSTGTVPGHINPTRIICRKIIERGHEVVWITSKINRKTIERTGAIFHPLPDRIDRGNKSIYEFYPELANLKGVKQVKWYIKHMFLDNAPYLVKAIDSILKDYKADALVGDTIAFGLFFQAELLQMPSAMISLLPLSLTSQDTAPFGLGLTPGNNFITTVRNKILNYFTNCIIFKDVNKYANQKRAELGLPAFRKPFLRQIFEIPSIVMQISTPAFEYQRRDQPDNLRFIGPILIKKDPAFSCPLWWNELKKNKVILINQGTVATDLKNLIIPAIEALKNEDYMIIAVPVKDGESAHLPGNTRNVKIAQFIPFGNLLPYVDVMVTNGGYGGTQLALAHGIPLLVAGQTEDKMEVAARVQWSKAGIRIKGRVIPEDIKKKVEELLTNPTYKKNAERIKADFSKYDALENTSILLEELISPPKV